MTMLTLTLFVPGIFTDNANDTLTPHNLAFFADSFY